MKLRRIPFPSVVIVLEMTFVRSSKDSAEVGREKIGLVQQCTVVKIGSCIFDSLKYFSKWGRTGGKVNPNM